MKSLFALLISILLVAGANAQTFNYPAPITQSAPGVVYGQMLNTSNTYVGSRNDTATNSTALYLYVCKIATSGLPVAYPLYAKGSISFNVSGIKITGNPAGSLSVEQSFDGTNWAPVKTTPTIASISTDSVGVIYTTLATYTYNSFDLYSIQDVAGTQSYSFNIGEKHVAYYRIKVGVSGTQTSSWKAWFCLISK